MGIWETFTSDKQWQDYLQALVRDNDYALRKAVVLIYNRQTEVERSRFESTEDNGIGFTKWDAKVLTNIAKKITVDLPLTSEELSIARNKMPKYWRQLMEISKAQMEKHTEERKAAKLAMFRENLSALQKCAEQGISCDYGICDECPVTCGLQIRFHVVEE